MFAKRSVLGSHISPRLLLVCVLLALLAGSATSAQAAGDDLIWTEVTPVGVWDDVRFVSCPYLRDLPDGVPIPEDAGEPPQP